MKCGKKAISKVIWVDGSVINMCAVHEGQIRGICQLMSWPVTIVTLGTEDFICESEISDEINEKSIV